MFKSEFKETIERMELQIMLLTVGIQRICHHPSLYEDISIDEQVKKNGYIYKCNTCSQIFHKDETEEYVTKSEWKNIRAKKERVI